MSNSALPEEITRILLVHRFGVLATYGGEYPYTSLISLVFSNDFRYLVFPTLRETRKYANLCHETRVSVLLDNRSFETRPEKLYALTILGSALETDQAMHAVSKELFLKRHPNLAEFFALPQTALIQITLKKIILVEELQKIREFDCSPAE
jgi:nitroimidazol reductase NimA-like FMN-containing flavoprotein (pyridoxamine 5'-phosphate oxidase superfamily)